MFGPFSVGASPFSNSLSGVGLMLKMEVISSTFNSTMAEKLALKFVDGFVETDAVERFD